MFYITICTRRGIALPICNICIYNDNDIYAINICQLDFIFNMAAE